MKSINLTATKNMRSVLRDNGISQDISGNSKSVQITGKSHQHKIFQKYGTYERNDISFINTLPQWTTDRSYQFELIDSIYADLSNNTPWHSLIERCLTPKQSTWVTREMERKLAGYITQDERKNRKTSDPLSLSQLCDKFKKEDYRCHYCRELLSVIYRDTRSPTQWSLDRIDNDKPHDTDNVVLACYACNVRRRCRSYRKFKESFSVEHFDKI